MEKRIFPDGFFWGSATSAHQVEGNNKNDWSEWEKSQMRRDQLIKEGKDPVSFISGNACDSYNRYREDIDIVKSLSQNMHRFSIEWSRIEPEEGKYDFNAIQHYIDIVKYMKERKIEPMITLWHFTNPIWFSKDGGWLNPKSPDRFIRFIKVVVDNFLKEKAGVRYWATFNEAFTIYAAFTKLSATWPSRDRGVVNFLKTRRNIAKAHILAYRTIKETYGLTSSDSNTHHGDASHNVMVGIVENNVYVPDTKNIWRTKLRRVYKHLRNFYFFKNNIPYYDFIGLNYYHMSRKPSFDKRYETVSEQEINKEMGWELYPPGIYHCLMDLKKYGKPIFITENGIADSKDKIRGKFVKDHLIWVHKAIQDGVDVRGYLYWSLLDNFEWHHGFYPRFGLVEVDYKTFERRIRPSALEYAKISLANQLEVGF